MGFSVIFDTKTTKELSKLPPDTKTRIFKKIIETKIDPFRFFDKLEGREDYRLRVGDYRGHCRYKTR
ncbi:MAG: type II toxin-antitoxin system RelE family toxin [Candidatus Methanofastidiosia archaeon]